MSPTFSTEQVLALAPDAQVAHAAQALAQPGKWQAAGQDDSVVWGCHQGSGGAPYQVAVDLEGPAFKCTCPSRKRPCKHALGLFLLLAGRPESAPRAARPAWVAEWTESAAASAGRAATRKASAESADPEEQAGKPTARQAQREKRVGEGVAALALWIEDLVRQGLAATQSQPAGFWQNQAARMVDAQAPGLARRVRDLAGIPHSGEGWPTRLLHSLAGLHLLLEGYERLPALPPELQAELRSQIGWTQDQEALRLQPGTRDRWLVAGQRLTEEDRLRVQRTWLWGTTSRIGALVLDFAPAGRPIECSLVPGASLDAELVFWPGASPQRALVKAQYGIEQMCGLAGYPELDLALAAYGAAVAANPWLDRFLMPLSGVMPARQGSGWTLCDGVGRCLPLRVSEADGWRMLALGGGGPLAVVGEWDSESLEPLSVWTGQQLIPLGSAQAPGGAT